MNLKTYLHSMLVPDRKAFAERCGTTYQHLQNIIYGDKSCGEPLALAIQRESGGAVSVEELRPAFAAALRQAGYEWVRKSTNELLEAA